jgi:hypothetical protein
MSWDNSQNFSIQVEPSIPKSQFLSHLTLHTYTSKVLASRTMSKLTPEAFDLQGGCDCKAIRYKISVPHLE